LVVVAGVLPKDPFEMATAQDEHPIEAFGANRAHPALGVGVGPRSSDRRLDHPDAFRAKHLVEAGRELGVPIPDQELDGSAAVYKVADQVGPPRGAGPRPVRRRTRRIELAETRSPSFRSSP